MKKLFLLLMICVSTFVNAQEKTIQTVYKDSKDGISTVYKDLKSTTPQIKNVLESLSKELKTTTDSLWSILVKQQLVWSWCFLILTFSSIFNWFLFYKRNLSNIKYEIVKGKVQKLQYKEGVTEKDTISYPSTYGKQYFNVEEEVLKTIPQSTISFFKYFHLIICLILSIFSFYHFSDMLTGFINPEFGALKTITEVVGNLK
jgi:hypothetical protein